MTGRKSKIKGWRLDEHGKLVKDVRRLDVSTRLKQRHSKKVRVVKKGAS